MSCHSLLNRGRNETETSVFCRKDPTPNGTKRPKPSDIDPVRAEWFPDVGLHLLKSFGNWIFSTRLGSFEARLRKQKVIVHAPNRRRSTTTSPPFRVGWWWRIWITAICATLRHYCFWGGGEHHSVAHSPTSNVTTRLRCAPGLSPFTSAPLLSHVSIIRLIRLRSDLASKPRISAITLPAQPSLT